VVTDSIGCSTSLTDTVQSTDPVTDSVSVTNPSACGVADGAATVTIITGTSPYAYTWSNGQANSSATGLAAGSYTVTVTDFIGCTSITTVNVVDANAPTLSVTASSDVNCLGGSDGSISVTAFNGTAPFSYAWSDGQTTQTASGLAAGGYSVTVTDDDGCAAIISDTLSEPATAIVIDSISSTDITCNAAGDGTAYVSASGGTGTISYSWSTGGSNATTTGLSAGTVTVVATDANGCTVTDSLALLSQLSLLLLLLAQTSLVTVLLMEPLTLQFLEDQLPTTTHGTTAQQQKTLLD
jgi:hypothetical protein